VYVDGQFCATNVITDAQGWTQMTGSVTTTSINPYMMVYVSPSGDETGSIDVDDISFKLESEPSGPCHVSSLSSSALSTSSTSSASISVV
jgi:hypothetical protein